ncbi:MAG: hypothetical protein LBS51_06775 [Oscillospiraceae bacterium]|jgi:hypothetical protein|nr:hypothetical protein [Oscillospiraceae bacterium]
MLEKYERMFYEFTPERSGCDWIHSPYAYFHGERAFPGAKFNVGFQVVVKEALADREPHFHPDDEHLIFMGAKWPNVFDSWNAEVWLYMGPALDKMEKIVINAPTIVQVPRGWWHGPLEFKRVTKPVLFQTAVKAGAVETIRLVDTGKAHIYQFTSDAGGKGLPSLDYPSVPWTVLNEDTGALSEELRGHVCVIPREDTSHGPSVPSPQAYFRGETYLKTATVHMGWQVIAGELPMENAHFHQGIDEYIFFMGADPMNIFDFDAEIEVQIGDDPDSLETKVITKPTVLCLPANTWHCPIMFKRITKPIMFQAAFMSGVWGTIERHTGADGKASYSYMGDNVRFCVYDSKKTCNFCGACFKKTEGEPQKQA